MIKIEKSIEEALEELQEEIYDRQSQINLIKNIDWNKPVTEEKWHEICETPLRSSDLLEVLVKNIFPDAEKIKVGCNCVCFEMYEFTCGLPTSRCNGVYIQTDWYKKDYGEPSYPYSESNKNMKKYFDAKDNHENWDILFKYRLPYLSSYKKWIRFILWFGYYRWKNDHREKWIREFEKDEKSFEQYTKHYHEKRKTIHDKTVNMVNILIPELKKFSNKIRKLDGYSWYQVDDIIKWEGLSE